MARKCRINNRMLRNIRKNDEAYQAVVIDLKLIGKISAAEAKELLGYDVPDYLTLDTAAASPSPASLDVQEEEVEEPENPDDSE